MELNYVNIIKEDISKKEGKYIARNYYNHKNSKDDGLISYVDTAGNTKTLNLSKDSELYTNFFRLIVNQKLDYLLAKEPTLKNDKYSITRIVDLLEDLVLSASLDTTAWVQFYIYNNELDWLIVPDKEVIPYYDRYNKNLEELIKYFLIDKDTFYVEHWTLRGLKTFKIHKDRITDVMNKSHFEVKTFYVNGDIDSEDSKNFNSIPFIPMFNNKSKKSDIEGIKELLDMYNSISSGFIKNINVFQEFILKLKGYASDSNTLDEVLHNIKKYKAMSLQEGADADYMKVDIPVEARQVILDIIKENIFLISQSMNPTQLGDGNITNIVIQSRYAALDMKANKTEKQIKLFYEKFANFLQDFYKSLFDGTIICNRSMLFNITEAIKNCVDSKGIISDETIVKNHPFVSDSKEELKLIEKEKQNNMMNDVNNSNK